jgi:hypothetical protein
LSKLRAYKSDLWAARSTAKDWPGFSLDEHVQKQLSRIQPALISPGPTWSDQGAYAVDSEHCAGNVALPPSKKRDGVGDIVDVGEPLERAAADDALPGATALALMPSRPTSRADERVKPIIDALVAAEAESPLCR